MSLEGLYDVMVNEEQERLQRRRINGVVSAIVTNNNDPEHLGRVRVNFPWLAEESESYWAKVASFMAGNDRGSFFLPEVGDEVLVAFEHGDINFPYVIGALWNGEDTPPESNSDGRNNIKKIKTRSGHEIVFDDSESQEKIVITSKSGHHIILDDTAGGEKIVIEDKNGNSIKMDAVTNTITMKSSIKLSIEANIIDIKADSVLTLQGGIVRIN